MLHNDKFIKAESANTKKWKNEEYWEPGNADVRFTCVLTCTNDFCREDVICSGMEIYQFEVEFHRADPSDPTDFDEVFDYFRPHLKPMLFIPHLVLFEIPSSIGKEIQSQINLSFSHFFFDSSAASNALRTALELIMDERGVSKIPIGKTRRNSLHKRIEEFGKLEPELKPFLEAAKWIGNAGSHSSHLSREDILDGYEMLEHVLDELYVKPDKMNKLKTLTLKAQEINIAKKPRSEKDSK